MNRKFQQHRARWGRFQAAVASAKWVAFYVLSSQHVMKVDPISEPWDDPKATETLCGIRVGPGVRSLSADLTTKPLCKRCSRSVAA